MFIGNSLIKTTSRRWPGIFDEESCLRIKSLVKERYGDEETAETIYFIRHTLLLHAFEQCSVCEDCPASEYRYGKAVWGDGYINADIFVIGEAPTELDQRTAIPLSSRREYANSRCFLDCTNCSECLPEDVLLQGKGFPDTKCPFKKVSLDSVKKRIRAVPKVSSNALYLNNAISGLFTRASWNNMKPLISKPKIYSPLYITNLVKCRNVRASSDSNAPTQKSIRNCRKWLDIQLWLIQPSVVILLGSHANVEVFGKDFKVSHNHGKFIECANPKELNLPTSVKRIGTAYHPAYLAHEAERVSSIELDELCADMRIVFEKAFLYRKEVRDAKQVSY